ncbi:MAG: ATP-binding protein, partial [Gammaproteobacteria bacterium]|nr:ATP-binding protein [Gammaproteobacteria bacterium]
VDKNPAAGQFLLTGSSNILHLPIIPDSLAGRAGYVRLRPLAQGEILGNSPTFLERAYTRELSDYTHSLSRNDLIALAFRGGYPAVLALPSEADRATWFENYIKTTIERDLRDISHIRRIEVLQNLVTILAAWSSQFVDISSIARTLEVNRVTISTYIRALELMYLVEKVPHWPKSDYEYATKQSKFFITDTGLMAALLNWELEESVKNSERVGKLIETFVYTQLAAQIEAASRRFKLYHYRDQKKREIDFLIAGPEDSLIGIEVKSGTVLQDADFKHLRWFKANLAKDCPFVGIVVYAGPRSISLGDGFWAVPITALFE